MKTTLYLASASPRRHELLNQIGVVHHILNVPATPGEDEPRHLNETPLAYVQRTALDKAIRAQEYLEKEPMLNVHPSFTHQQTELHIDDRFQLERPIGKNKAILTADTTVAFGDLVLGKPTDAADAAQILKLLSGQTHTVHTAVVLFWNNQQWQVLSTSNVTFAVIPDDEIDRYIQTREPFGKAGAYGIQGYAAKFISRIEGSYSGVMGLPLYETATLLKQLN